NYKPPPQSIQSAKVRRSGRASDTRVSLTCKDPNAQGEFQYTGTQQPSGSYALIYRPSTKSLVLEKLDVDFNFNLQTTPSNHDRSQVTSQYPQLDTGISDPESDDGSTTEAPAVEAPPNTVTRGAESTAQRLACSATSPALALDYKTQASPTPSAAAAKEAYPRRSQRKQWGQR
ncbi:MAG: hypothetical protein LQ341_007811, partial [Variospora aurantia]